MFAELLASALFRFIGAGLIGALLGSAAGYTARGYVDSGTISGLRTSLAEEKTKVATGETKYKTLVAQNATDAAEANAEALKAIQSQAEVANQLRLDLAKAEAKRVKADRELVAALNRAEADKAAVMLSPAVLAYVQGVWAQQNGDAP